MKTPLPDAQTGISTAPKEHLSRDFGGLIERRPLHILHVRDSSEVVSAVLQARRRGMFLAARGQGHSTRGQSLVADGQLLVMGGLDHVHIERDRAVVGAGARWDAVLRAAWAHGLTPPVLTDYLGLSVGGTLSVGGVGSQSFRHGMQTDQLLALRVVTGRGELRTCSPREEPALFDAARAGLGQVGILVEATLRLIAAPPRLHVYRLRYEQLEPFLEDQRQLVEDGRFHGLCGSLQVGGGERGYLLEATAEAGTHAADLLHGLRCRRSDVERTECSYYEHACRLQVMERERRADGTWDACHPWMDLFLPGSRAGEFIAHASSELERIGMRSGHLMLYPLHGRVCRTPLLPVPADPHAFLFDVLPDVPRDPALLVQWETLSARLLARARALGGSVYPIGFPVGTAHADWPAHFRSAWPAFSEARAEYDPEGVLTPGPAIFTESERPLRSQTLGELARERLLSLGRAAGQESAAMELAELVPALSSGWAQLVPGAQPARESDLTDDGTPFELSVALVDGRAELRLLIEPQPASEDARDRYRTALALACALPGQQAEHAAQLLAVADLFAPQGDDRPRFSLWFGVQMSAEGALFKVYLNPEIRAASAARGCVQEALRRLGLASAWSFLSARLGPEATLPYFLLDLLPREQARVKVYVAHHGERGAQLARSFAGCANHREGDVAHWLDALVDVPQPAARPVLTCFSFTRAAAAPEITLHVPIRCHVANDLEALRRAQRVCSSADSALLERLVQAAVLRPLEAGRGALSYVSMRRVAERVRVTTYLAPQLYPVSATEPFVPLRLRGVHALVAEAQQRYASHPFFARMERAGSRAEAALVAQWIAFFIMTFQDMLRLACERCSDPEIGRMLRTHAAEDGGHDRWFLADLEQLGLPCDLRLVFAPERAAIRDVSYALLASLLRSQHDEARLALLLALEGAGFEFFSRFCPFLQQATAAEGLVFFGRFHQEVEASHDAFQQGDDAIWARVLEPGVADEVRAVIRETFMQMTRVAETMEQALSACASALEPPQQAARPACTADQPAG